MPRHLKVFGQIERETPNAYNRWVILNPEFQDDDYIVDMELEDLDQAIEDLWWSYETPQPTHGFNGHDPLEDDDYGPQPIFRDDYPYESYEDEASYYTGDFLDSDVADPEEDWLPEIDWDTSDQEPEAQLIEDPFESYDADLSSLPFMQSMRMGVREQFGPHSGYPRWDSRRKPHIKRYRPSRRPFVKNWWKSA